MKVNEVKKYSKKCDYSYTLGAFPTFELVNKMPQQVECVLLHSKTSEEIRQKICLECNKKGIRIEENDRIIEKIRDKDNILLIGVFNKYKMSLENGKNHVVLVNPSDAGNLGTIVRTCIGFGINNLAIIGSAADIFNPKAIRSSMGAIFGISFQIFKEFDEYYNIYGSERICYPFMLKGEYVLGEFVHEKEQNFSLIFGNESSGLDDSYLEIGRSVVIDHSNNIDSLNLSLATGIGIYEFTKMIKK